MRDITEKITGSTLTADEWNDVPGELENAIKATEIALTSADLFQLSKSISNYVAAGSFYTGGGVANAYTCSVIGSRNAPTSYWNGMKVRAIIPAGNTGASTINVAGLGIKSIKKNGALTELASGDMPAGYAEFVYIESANAFNLETIYSATEARPGKVELATNAETVTGTDTTRAVHPAGVKAAIDASLVGIQFEDNTNLYFPKMSSPPAGWTLDASANDRLLMVVNDGSTGNIGAWPISGLDVLDTTLTTSHIPTNRYFIQNLAGPFPGPVSRDTGSGFSVAQGGGQAHGHGITHDGNWRPSSVRGCIGTWVAP